jgi:hypothetical protein
MKFTVFVPAKIIKLLGFTRPPFLNLITFAGTQNVE